MQCSVCFEDKKCVTTHCNHTFCKKCLNTWCRSNKTCPVCRSNIYRWFIENAKIGRIGSIRTRSYTLKKTIQNYIDIIFYFSEVKDLHEQGLIRLEFKNRVLHVYEPEDDYDINEYEISKKVVNNTIYNRLLSVFELFHENKYILYPSKEIHNRNIKQTISDYSKAFNKPESEVAHIFERYLI